MSNHIPIICDMCREVGPLPFDKCMICEGMNAAAKSNANAPEPTERYNRLYPERSPPANLNYTIDMPLCDESDNLQSFVNEPVIPSSRKVCQELNHENERVKIPLLGSGPNIPLPLRQKPQQQNSRTVNPFSNHMAAKTGPTNPRRNRFGSSMKNQQTFDPSGSANQKKVNRIKNRARIAQLEKEVEYERR